MAGRSSRRHAGIKTGAARAPEPGGPHGARELPGVMVDGYNARLRDKAGDFLGDRASDTGLRDILERLRRAMRDAGTDPLGEQPTDEIGDKKLDKLLKNGEPAAAGLVWSALEEFAQELTHVVRTLLCLPEWRGTERIAVGGGFSGARVGDRVIGRAGVLLRQEGVEAALAKIHHDPDCAGLVGAMHLVPAWHLDGFDAALAVDIGGTKLRAGIVELHLAKAADLSAAEAREPLVWRHADDGPGRDQMIERLVEMLTALVKDAEKDELRLAPFIGIACPGTIAGDGQITQGAQNLPGQWEAARFNLPRLVCEAIPAIGRHPTAVRLHNDAVVQGLSEMPYMQDVARWGILTIGTGLGNARFTNRRDAAARDGEKPAEARAAP